MSNITFAPFPIPVVTPKGNGYVVYFKCNSMWENDEALVAMDEGGQYYHFNTGQLQAWKNATYGISTAIDWEAAIKKFQNTPLQYLSGPSWSDEDMVEFAAYYGKQQNHLDPSIIIENFKKIKKKK